MLSIKVLGLQVLQHKCNKVILQVCYQFCIKVKYFIHFPLTELKSPFVRIVRVSLCDADVCDVSMEVIRSHPSDLISLAFTFRGFKRMLPINDLFHICFYDIKILNFPKKKHKKWVKTLAPVQFRI